MENLNVPQRSFKDYLIPYFSYTYKSALSKEEILNRIKLKTEPERMFRAKGLFASGADTNEFEGEVTLTGFKINRISKKKKKSNAPVIIGELSSSNQNTSVKIRVRFNLLLFLILPFWVFISAQVFFSKMDFNFFEGDFNWAILIPFVIVLLIYVIFTGSFHYNLTKELKFLQQIIEPLSKSTSGASWIIRN